MPSTVYRSCPLCEATCGLAITTEGDRVVSVRGDDDDPFSKGYLCPKAAALADLHDDPDRLQRPVVRDGASWRELGWDAAFDLVARRLGEVRAAHGRDAIAVYQGNPTVHNLGLMTYGQLLCGLARHAQPVLGDVARPAAAHARGAADVRQPAADAGARHRSQRSVHLPGRQPAGVERQHHDRARRARPAGGDPRAAAAG